MSDYCTYYFRAEGVLRSMNMSQRLPGFEYLKMAAAISKQTGITDTSLLIEKIEKETMKISSREVAGKKTIKEGRGMVEQSMIEAIRSVSSTDRKMSLSDFIDLVVSAM